MVAEEVMRVLMLVGSCREFLSGVNDYQDADAVLLLKKLEQLWDCQNSVD